MLFDCLNKTSSLINNPLNGILSWRKKYKFLLLSGKFDKNIPYTNTNRIWYYIFAPKMALGKPINR